jgi:hypothetical protein
VLKDVGELFLYINTPQLPQAHGRGSDHELVTQQKESSRTQAFGDDIYTLIMSGKIPSN